jgi:hypothetical protein
MLDEPQQSQIQGPYWKAAWSHIQLDSIHALREAKRNRTQFLIGCSSIFIVVLVVALMSTGIPVITLNFKYTQIYNCVMCSYHRCTHHFLVIG